MAAVGSPGTPFFTVRFELPYHHKYYQHHTYQHTRYILSYCHTAIHAQLETLAQVTLYPSDKKTFLGNCFDAAYLTVPFITDSYRKSKTAPRLHTANKQGVTSASDPDPLPKKASKLKENPTATFVVLWVRKSRRAYPQACPCHFESGLDFSQLALSACDDGVAQLVTLLYLVHRGRPW